MKLTNPTDDQLDAAFAEKVAGWTVIRQSILGGQYISRWCPPNTPDAFNLLALDTKPPRFTQSFDAVLPWLEKSPFDVVQTYSNTCCVWTVRLQGRFTSNKEFVGKSEEGPAKAAVIALLRSHGVEIEFTQ